MEISAYIDRTIPDDDFKRMMKETPEFFAKCKAILIKLNENKIKDIRSQFQKEIN
jgi:hypothetical protein